MPARVREPGRHLGVHLDPGEHGQELGELLRELGAGGHEPLAGLPVEAAAGQALDGGVQQLVEREAEDQRAVAAAVQPEAHVSALRLLLEVDRGKGHPTDSMT